MSADPTSLATKANYLGSEQVYVGNGKGLLIKRIGSSQSLSPSSSKLLTLQQMLHVPEITKNLSSVSKFAWDNQAFFEFHPFVCFVKDQVSKTVPLEGRLKGGLYAFDSSQIPLHKQSTPSSSPSVYQPLSHSQCLPVNHVTFSCSNSFHPISVNVTSSVPVSMFDVWHDCLVHPSTRSVQHFLANYQVFIDNKNVSSSVCKACCYGKIHKFPFPHSDTEYNKPL